MFCSPFLGLGQISDSLEIEESEQFIDSLSIGDSIPIQNNKTVN